MKTIEPKTMRKLVVTTIAVLTIIVVTMFIATCSSNNADTRNSFTPQQQLQLSEQLDSIAAHLDDSTKIVSRISNDTQYGIVYMKGGRIYLYDAVENTTNEINPYKMNVAARVSQSDGGILTARVDADENYILMVAAIGPKSTERGLYRYDLHRKKLTVLSIGKVDVNGSGFIVYEKDLEIHFNSSGDKISELLHNENIEDSDSTDIKEEKPIKRRRSEQVTEDIEAGEDSPESILKEAETNLEPVPRLDNQ